MKHRRAGALAGVIACAVLLGVSEGAATTIRKTAYVTFPEMVQLPGVTLPRGTYIFERASRDAHHQNVIQVTSRDRSRRYFLGVTTSAARPHGSGDASTIVFGEGERNAPRPIVEWHPYAEPIGHRFIYGRRGF